MLFGAVGEHHPDLAVADDRSLEDNMQHVRRPAGKVVASGVMGKLQPPLAGDVHYIDVLSAGRPWPVLPVPTESEKLAVRRPRRRNGVASIRHALDVGPVLIHDVDLGQAGTAAYPRDLRIGARVPGGTDVGSAKRRELTQISTVRVGNPDFRVSRAR